MCQLLLILQGSYGKGHSIAHFQTSEIFHGEADRRKLNSDHEMVLQRSQPVETRLHLERAATCSEAPFYVVSRYYTFSSVSPGKLVGLLPMMEQYDCGRSKASNILSNT